jgi:hypothetical protein
MAPTRSPCRVGVSSPTQKRRAAVCLPLETVFGERHEHLLSFV